jgi:hypothetical protein
MANLRCSLPTFLAWNAKELMKNYRSKYKENIKFPDVIRVMLIDGVLVAIVQKLTLRLKALPDKAYSFKTSLGLRSSKIEPSSAYVASQCH